MALCVCVCGLLGWRKQKEYQQLTFADLLRSASTSGCVRGDERRRGRAQEFKHPPQTRRKGQTIDRIMKSVFKIWPLKWGQSFCFLFSVFEWLSKCLYSEMWSWIHCYLTKTELLFSFFSLQVCLISELHVINETLAAKKCSQWLICENHIMKVSNIFIFSQHDLLASQNVGIPIITSRVNVIERRSLNNDP